MKIFPEHFSWSTPGFAQRAAFVALGIATFVGAGTLFVKASDNPQIYQTIIEFNRPIRRAVETYAPLPKVFQRQDRVPPQALSYAPRTERLRELPRLNAEPDLRRREPDLRQRSADYVAPRAQPVAPRTLPVLPLQINTPVVAVPAALPNNVLPHERKGRRKLQARAEGMGAPTAMNYCVRLCDGFAFPVGAAGAGTNAQETACRSACPGAQTALFYSPAGAKDFSDMSRGSLSYGALPTAFRYREKLTDACSCRPVGATQSSLALLNDVTLRKGDLVMSRIGFRHFDGAARYPLQARNFSDALTKLKDRKEVAVIRAMEVASVRGILPSNAPSGVRSRIVADIRNADAVAKKAAARETRTREISGFAKGFVELRARETARPTVLKVVKRPVGFVAMN
jgi:hypothetical protein